jgi:hypothetical protein
MERRVAPAPFLARVRARLIDALALYLAQPVRRTHGVAVQNTQPLSAVLRHGDVLLTNGNTRAAAIVRRLTGSTWAHVAMYIAGAWAVAKRLLRLPVSRLAPAATVADGARRFICSSLLAQAFLLVGYQILPAGGTGAARVGHPDLTPRDFESASGFEVVSAKQPG